VALLHPRQQGFRLGPTVGFHVADDHVDAFTLRLPPGFKHGVGLADAGHHAKEDFQLPALLARRFLLDGSQQHIRDRVGPGRSARVP
jgi:hypothetical protein